MQTARKNLFGCPVDSLSRDDILAAAKTAMKTGRAVTIEGLNVAKLIAAQRDPALMQALTEADLVHIDGLGIALGAKLLGCAFPPRCAGIDLMSDLLALCATEGASVFLLGAKPEIVAAAAQAIQNQFPTLKIAGYQNGYFAEAEAADIAQHIAASGAALLLVGMSSPKKEMFLHRHMSACNVRVAMGVGGAFDVVAGTIPRAPLWMQHGGLEWLFRLLQEPRRLAWRYLESNALFAGILLRELIKKHAFHQLAQPPLSWKEFLNFLQQYHSEAAMVCRHEIYFLRQKKYAMRLCAIGALLRDIVMLYMLPQSREVEPKTRLYAVASLPGASGHGTVKRAMEALPENMNCTLVTHPRLGIDGVHPARLALRDALQAITYACSHVGSRSPISRVIVFACVMRSALWQAAWRRFYAQHPVMEKCILHNDFDMMNSALVAALSPKVEMVCIQHGIPTDEFFPTRAPIQFVWGETSRAAYAKHHAGKIKIDALGRSKNPLLHRAIPQALHVISQTHTPIYGIDLAAVFKTLLQGLLPSVAQINLSILLHPEEKRNAAAYRHIDARYIALPPHASLQQMEPVCLMIGYSSTALIEAAMAGHYVAAMDWPAAASVEARAVSLPPVQCVDAAAVLALWNELRASAPARERHQAAQREWLAATFVETGQFAAYFG